MEVISGKYETLLLIKPRAWEKNGYRIVRDIQKEGFRVAETREVQMDEKDAREFYAEHEGKNFYPTLVEYMTSGPILAVKIVSDDENLIKNLRKFVGNTDPAKAEEGTLRRMYGCPELYEQGQPTNAIHASDSPESASRELPFFFPEQYF